MHSGIVTAIAIVPGITARRYAWARSNADDAPCNATVTARTTMIHGDTAASIEVDLRSLLGWHASTCANEISSHLLTSAGVHACSSTIRTDNRRSIPPTSILQPIPRNSNSQLYSRLPIAPNANRNREGVSTYYEWGEDRNRARERACVCVHGTFMC